jgi:hypothetical protein
MLPHTMGEAQSIAEAFHNCHLAFHRFDESSLDDRARSLVLKIKGFMDTGGIDDSTGVGTWVLKAKSLNNDEKLELSNAVDELASWFNRKFWGLDE